MTENCIKALEQILTAVAEGQSFTSKSSGLHAATLRSLVIAGAIQIIEPRTSPLSYTYNKQIAEQVLSDAKAENAAKDKSLSDNLRRARKVKNDEFFTLLADIEAELEYYDADIFRDKVIVSCCNDFDSAFYHLWTPERLHQMSPRVVLCFGPQGYHILQPDDCTPFHFYDGGGTTFGDFRAPEILELINSYADRPEDVVIFTNPPFSLFRDFITWAIDTNHFNFFVIGNLNAATYTVVFPHFQSGLLHLGVNMVPRFAVADDYEAANVEVRDGKRYARFGNITWYSTLPLFAGRPFLPLIEHYSAEKYPFYDNYNAIEVSRVKNIPCDTDLIMGVPITFLRVYNPAQFRIIGQTAAYDKSPEVEALRTSERNRNRALLDGKMKYDRILIKRIS